jgi:hypothetical protein
MTAPVLLVRFLPGVPEEIRPVHVVPTNMFTPNLMVAYCGELFWPGEAEQVSPTEATEAICEECASMTRPVIYVRFKRGIVGETRRTVHVVPAPDPGVIPDVLFALCGERIKPGTAEQLDRLDGMPCNPCILSAPMPSSGELPPATDPASS